ncbi:MAG: hypothetical protein HRT77_16990 [Halioglobus sp.]|nr:hypothetical protein [Halioglobus sp.]
MNAGEQGELSSGIPYVIVGGQLGVEDAVFKKVWAGRPARCRTAGFDLPIRACPATAECFGHE